MSDESYLDRAQRLSKLRNGQELSDTEITEHFLQYAPERRVEILERIDKDLQANTNITPGTNNFRAAADHLATRRKLQDMHVALRKANR
jgi:hypothetical protein